MSIGVKGREHLWLGGELATHTNERTTLVIRQTCSDDHRESTRNVFEEHVAEETTSCFDWLNRENVNVRTKIEYGTFDKNFAPTGSSKALCYVLWKVNHF